MSNWVSEMHQLHLCQILTRFPPDCALRLESKSNVTRLAYLDFTGGANVDMDHELFLAFLSYFLCSYTPLIVYRVYWLSAKSWLKSCQLISAKTNLKC
jgi:hypothetical protein